MITKKDIIILVISLILAVLSYILLQIGRPDLSIVSSFILYSIAIGMSFLLLYEIIFFIIGKRTINPINLVYPILFAYAYFMSKKAVTGVIAEAMGAKGLLPAIVRLTSYFTGELGAWHQVLGVWIGFITFGAAFALLFYVLSEVAAGRLSISEARFISILAGFGVAAGFVTAHLAQTAYMYPFTVLGGTAAVYIPMYVFSFMISIAVIGVAIYFLILKSIKV